MRHIETSRFGKLTIEEESVITFPDGLIEYPRMREFAILGIEDYFPFLILTSVDAGKENLCFPLISPTNAIPDYHPSIPEPDQRMLEVDPLDDVQLYTIVSFGLDQPHMHVDLKHPIVINTGRMIGCQVELKEDAPRHDQSLDLNRIIGQSCP